MTIGTLLAATIALTLAASISPLLGKMRSHRWDVLLMFGALTVAVAGFLATFDYWFLVVGGVGSVIFGWVATSDAGSRDSDGDGENDHSIDEDAILQNPTRDFDDVGGMDDLKRKFRERVIQPIRNPDRYEEYGLGATNGVLLYGPPGCGKTFIAGALAGELGYNYVKLSPADLTSKWIGEGTENISKVFEVAEENTPCILFIDEIDAIASDRDDGMHNDRKVMVNQLLTELEQVPDDVVVVAATNYVDDIDSAILRSGRFDERIEVPPPDPVARQEILALHLPSAKTAADIDFDETVDDTAGYASSDMELVAELAARHAMGAQTDVSERFLQDAVAESSTSIPGWLDRYDGLNATDSGRTVTQPDGANLPAAEITDPEPELAFDDIPGVEAQKSEIVERLITPLANAERYESMGVNSVDGVLLYGPPGVGKADLGRAIAGELGFPTVSITQDSLLDRGEMDVSELIDDVFAVARANAPCVLFIDRLDELTPRQAPSEDNATFARYLASRLRAIEDHNVVVVGTATSPTDVDQGVLVSGCFDERVEVPEPTRETRIALLEDALDEQLLPETFDWERAADALAGYNNTDIRDIVERAARAAVREDEALTADAIADEAAGTPSSIDGRSREKDGTDSGLSYIN